MADPDIAVLIGAFNNEETIARSVASILGQRFEALELLVLDDGSSDDSAEAARAAIGSDPRGRVIQLGRNSGIATALNTGLDQTRAPLVAIQDADDWSEPHRVERQVEALRRMPEAAVVGGRMRELAPDGSELQPRTTFRAGVVNDVLMHFNPIPNGVAAMRREAVLALGGYDARYRYAAEYDLWLRVAERHTVFALDEVLAARQMGPGNVASRAERAQLGEALAIRLRAMRRRRSLRGASGLIRPSASFLAPLPLKRRMRQARGQAP